MLLVICENGLLTINRNFVVQHLDDDSEVLKANLIGGTGNYWESDWFSLGYAIETQTLREIFLKTNTNLILTVTSNRTQCHISVKAADQIQKIKVNLNGNQFKLLAFNLGKSCCGVGFGGRDWLWEKEVVFNEKVSEKVFQKIVGNFGTNLLLCTISAR